MTILTKWHKMLEAVKANRIGIGSERLPPKLLKPDWFQDLHKYTPVDKTSLRQVHMRRGHVHHQGFGAGLAETKLIYIEPVLVNYRGGDAPQIKVKW